MRPSDFDNIRTSSKRNNFNAQTHLFPIDETEEFYDPFSDLNLFLAKKIKKELIKNSPQEWSRKIQQDVLQNILPEFRQQFPQYRLGVTALKKTWEKVLHYLRVLQTEQHFRTEGRLDVDQMIKENLRPFFLKTTTDEFHPYNTTHQIALKISECIATVDGEKCEIDKLAKRIWLMQRHLLIKEELQAKTPFEQLDTLDQFIIRFQTEEIVHNPTIDAKTLQQILIKRIEQLKQIDRIHNVEELRPSLSALLAEKLYPTLSLHNTLSKRECVAIQQHIQYHFDQAKQRNLLQKELDYEQLKNRILFSYQLSSRMNKHTMQEQLSIALNYVHSIATNTFNPQSPTLQPFAYNFLEKELQLVQEHNNTDPVSYILQFFTDIYNNAQELPSLPSGSQQELEIFTWKVLQDRQKLTAKMPHYLHNILTQELGQMHMDRVDESFTRIIDITIDYCKKVRSIDIRHLTEKASLWAAQNDLLYAWIKFDNNNILLKCAQQLEEQQKVSLQSPEFAEILYQQITRTTPELSGWDTLLKDRCLVLQKYLYYHQTTVKEHTPYDRFLEWHYTQLITTHEPEFPELVFTRLRERADRLIPLLPFDYEYARKLLAEKAAYIAS